MENAEKVWGNTDERDMSLKENIENSPRFDSK